MGKAENIKRAKRLKEAKKQREQENFLASGIGPASLAIKKRVEANGDKIFYNKSGIKYSELLKSFVFPIIEDEDDIDTVRGKFIFGTQAWNASIVREKDEKLFIEARNEFIPPIPGNLEIEILFDELVKRKQAEFAEYKNLMVDFDIKKLNKVDYEVSVATCPFDEYIINSK